MANFDQQTTGFGGPSSDLDVIGDLLNDNLDEFFMEAPMKNVMNDDPFLNTHRINNNVLDIVGLPQNLLDCDKTQLSPYRLTEKSPWHESDSGVSETISVSGSPEHDSYDQMTNQDPGIHKGPTMHRLISEEELDNELAAYLQNDCPLPSPSKSCSDSNDLSFFAHSLDNELLASAEKGPLIDLTSNSSFLSISKSSKVSQIDNHANSNSQPAARSGPRPSEVKILKVVHPSNSSNGVTSEDIAKAMEERSKKNAAQAKQNREKKKAYIQTLENEVDGLKSSNENLEAENARIKRELADKDEEIAYLKSVLVNSSSLSNLLRNITDVKEVKLSANIMTRKRTAKDDHCYNLVENAPQKRARLIDENLKKAGVCLHVMGDSACLEFCAHCSKLAQKSHAHS